MLVLSSNSVLWLKGALDPLHSLLLVSVWEGCPCMRIYHMQIDFELCVLSEFRKGVI